MSSIKDLINKYAENIETSFLEDFYKSWDNIFSKSKKYMEATSLQEKCISDRQFWGEKI